MTVLVISVIVVLVVSALCSLTEAALYAVRMPYIRQLVDSGTTAGRLLVGFKGNMERPITAILILNTVANTAGAAVAGGQARLLLGEGALIWFSAIFTLAVLFFSEIVPKIAGVAFNRSLAPLLSRPLHGLIALMYPLVWLSQHVATLCRRGRVAPIAPEEEVWHFAAMSAEEGSILPFEADLIKNVLQLNDLTAQDMMTPRTVVNRVPSRTTVGELQDTAPAWPHTRIPVYDSDDPEKWIGFVLKDEVMAALAADQFDVIVETLCQPLGFVPDSAPGHFLFNEFIQQRQHVLGVVDEYGGLAGIVTFEDVIESLIGRQIVDETDVDESMRAVARRSAAQRIHRPEKPGAKD